MQVRKAILVAIAMLIMGQALLAQNNTATDNNTNYQKALTLYNSASPAEGIPYLESILQTNIVYVASTYIKIIHITIERMICSE